MSSTFNGSALQTRFAQKYGFSDATSLLRVLEWINEIQEDICDGYNWPFLKIKLKKQVSSGAQDVDLSPQIPSAPTLALLAGGSLTADTAVYVKTTFVIFADSSAREIDSIESEASEASAVATPTGANLSLTVTAIDTYDGDTGAEPTTIHRRLYLKSGSGDYYLSKTITDNTTTTTTITANTSSVIEPPQGSMVASIAENEILIEGSGKVLHENNLDDLLNYDPNLNTSGTPGYHARIGTKRIMLYPKPSASTTLSYWVYKKASRIYADTDRVIQMDPALKKVLDAGVTWKGYEYKDSDGQEGKLSNYEQLKSDAEAKIGRKNENASSVKVVC